MPSNTVLFSGPVVGAAQFLTWSYFYVFLLPMSTAIRTSVISFVELSMTFYMFHRHSVCLVDHVDLICSLYSWWEGFGSSSLATLPPGFQLWFYFHLCMWIIHWCLFPRLPWRPSVSSSEGQVWRWCSCLGCRGSGSTRYSGELAARAAGNTAL